MTEVLLTALNNQDIDWMTQVGQQQQFASGQVLIRQGIVNDALLIILEGTAAAAVGRNQGNILGQAFAAIEGEEAIEREIGRYSTGEVIGEILFLDTQPSPTTIKAVEPIVLLSIPQQPLRAKLRQDINFASRFYQAIATLQSQRFQRLLEQFTQRKMGQIQPIKEVLTVFGELSDGDVDWLIDHGSVENISANSLLIQERRPTEALYVFLNATMSVFVSENRRNSLTWVFAQLEGNSEQPNVQSQRELARLSTGEIAGETALLENQPPRYSVQATSDSLVLAIPRQQLIIKLQQDAGFAARFYRVVAILIAARIKALINRLGYGQQSYAGEGPLVAEIQYDDELDLDVLDHMELAGARFNWMLKRLKQRKG